MFTLSAPEVGKTINAKTQRLLRNFKGSPRCL